MQNNGPEFWFWASFFHKKSLPEKNLGVSFFVNARVLRRAGRKTDESICGWFLNWVTFYFSALIFYICLLWSKNWSIFHCKISPQSLLRDRKWTILLQNWLKSQFSRKLIHWLRTVQSTNFGFEGSKRSVMNDAMTFFCSFDKSNQF